MQMLCVSTRTSELLLCADTLVSGAAVVVEQARGPFAPEAAKPKSPKRDDPEARYRRLLAGAGLPMSPGQFAGDEYDSDDGEKNIDIATTDEYQGLQNDIILVSLVSTGKRPSPHLSNQWWWKEKITHLSQTQPKRVPTF